MISIGLLVVVFVIVFLLRLIPVLAVPRRGNDAYYFLLCAEALKRRPRLPIVLPPYYLLEYQEQWYPPGFSVFLALIPSKALQRYYWLISPAIDGIIGTITAGITYFLTDSLLASVVAGLLYALTLSTIRETIALTSRQLGSLFFALTSVMAITYVSERHFVYLAFYLCFGFLLIMTHKLSSQAFYILMPALSLIKLEPLYLLLLIALLGFTYIISGGFLWKVLKAHYEIIWFWNQHWAELGAHQVYESPIYGRKAPLEYVPNRNRYHQPGFKRGLYQLLYLLTGNPALMGALLVFGVPWFIAEAPMMPYAIEFFSWMTVVIAFGLLTIWVKSLRSLGEGEKYYKLTALPAAYIASLPLTTTLFGFWQWFYIAFLGLIFVAYTGWYLRFIYRYRQESNTTSDVFSDDLQRLLDCLNELPNPRLVCIPTHLCDTIAYHCRVPVLWGTHGYPFYTAQPFYPVLREPIEYFQEKYNLTHLILDTRYVEPKTLEFNGQLYNESGPYRIYVMKNGS